MASIQYVVNAMDNASGVFARIAASADGLDRQLADLSKRVAAPEVDLKDAKFTLGMVSAAKRLDKLSAMMAEPGADLRDTKFQAEILKINAQLDRLDARRVTATVSVDVDRSFLSRLRGGAGQGIGGALSALGPYGQAILYSILGGTGAALLPALLPALLGGVTGVGAAGGALMLGSAASQKLLQLQKSLQTATGPRAVAIQQQIATLQKTKGPEIAAFGSFQDVGEAALRSFNAALLSQGPGFSGGPGGHPAGPSFLTSLTGILKQIGGFVKTIGPGLGDLFRSSVPFLQMFVNLLERAAKILLPVFSQSLRQMQPFLPLISQGLLAIVQGLAGMIKAMGPGGMKAAAEIFVGLCKAMQGILAAVGWTAAHLAEWIMTDAHKIRDAWDWTVKATEDFRHRTAVIFDGVRHDIAHVWDQIWNNTADRVRRGWHDVAVFNAGARHEIASILDGIRHDIAHVWDMIWQNTVGRVIRGIQDVINWFKGLPGRAVSALHSLGSALYSIGRNALTEFWNGLRAVAPGILAWAKNFASGPFGLIGIFKSLFKIGSPSAVMYDIGKNLMLGLENGIKAHAQSAARAFTGSIPAGPHAISGAVGLGRAMAAARGWSGTQWDALYRLWQGESGWNRLARNPSSGAYGIPQALPGSKMGAAANPPTSSAAAQIAWGLGYIGSVYSSPVAAYSAWLSRSPHWYGSGLLDGLFTRPTLIGVGERGPERVSVTPAGAASGGMTVNINVHPTPLARPADIGREVATVLGEFKKSGGMIYRPGGF